jgi:hypothetical protein
VTTNFYFQNFPSNQITNEQLLVEDLVIEALGIYGMDVFYMPRSSRDPNGVDNLFGEDVLKQYKSAHPIEMYLENVTGMDGEGDFISKFGLEIRDELTLLVSRRRFKYTVGATNFNMPRIGDLTSSENSSPTRPREGDLVYIPMIQNFFEVTFVEHENDQAMFYTLGRGRGGNVYVYALKLKQYVFSDEVIETGNSEIDNQAFDHYRKTRVYVSTSNGNGKFIVGEKVYQGNSINNPTFEAIVHTSVQGRYLDLIRTQGNISNSLLRGATSNSSWTITSSNDMEMANTVFEDISDNFLLQTEGSQIIDFTEDNPFGDA